MKTSTSVATGSSGSIATLLFIIFLILKLTHVIDWSWWWVTAPLWIPAGIVIIICVVFFIIIKIINRN